MNYCFSSGSKSVKPHERNGGCNMNFFEKAECPYCQKGTVVQLPINYAPVFVYCKNCHKKFIIERRRQGFDVFTTESAPCDSDPDCREIEMSSSEEQ